MIALTLTWILLLPPGDAAHSRRPVKLSVTSPEARTAPGHPSFQATRILDVEFAAELKQRLSGEHELGFRVYTPKGKLYQAITVPFSGRGGPARRRRVAGYARPLEERPMKPAGHEKFVVTARMPVAGTWIMTNSLYGVWRVEAFLDDQAVGEKAFSIAP